MTESRPIPGWETAASSRDPAASSRDPGSFCPRAPGGADEACVPGMLSREGGSQKTGICGPYAGNGVRRATKPQRKFAHFCGRDVTSGSVGKDAKGPVCGARSRGTSVSRAT